MRELHWHPNGDEWQYYLEGEGRMTVFGSEGKARTFDYRAGDVGYVPFAMGHYIENTGSTPMRFLEVFRSDRYRGFFAEPVDEADTAGTGHVASGYRPVGAGRRSSARESHPGLDE